MALNKINKQMIDDEFVQDVENVKNKSTELTAQLAEKVGGQRKLEPEELSDRSMALVTGNGIVNVLSIPQEKSVTPTKTTFMETTRNLFDGNYARMALTFSGTPASLKFRGLLAGELQKTAIIPIEASKHYTVKVHEPALKNVFKIAILNIAPDLANVNWQQTDVTVLNNDTLTEYTFKNTAEGRFLLVYVSSTGALPKLQVEEGFIARDYTERYVVPNTFMQSGGLPLADSKNLFDGDYYRLALAPTGTPMQLRYRGLLPTEKEKTAIIPLEANETYTVKVHDTTSDKFRIAIMNVFPDILDINNKNTDFTVISDDTKKEHTFTNTADGRFALVFVSSTDAKPKLQVEKGTTASRYQAKKVIPADLIAGDAGGGSTTIINNTTNTSVYSAVKAPREAIIIGAQEDETPTVTNATLSYDTVNYKVGSRGYKLAITGAVTASLIVNPISAPASVKRIGVIGLWVHIKDASKVSSIWVDIYSNAAKTVSWSVSSADSQSLVLTGLKNGWNYIRWTASHANAKENNLTDWGTIYSTRIMVVTSGATEVTIGKMVGEISQKAQILVVEDAQYKTFHDIAYQDLKARNIPVTWALRISTLGANVGTLNEQLTESDIERVSKENNNSISFHSFDGTNSTMTATELRIETMKAIKWLSARGYTGWHWRAAFLQNSAPAHAAIRDLVSGYSMPAGGQYVLGAFPFLNPYNTPRIGIHGVTPEDITKTFAKLKQTHQLYICYTHGISDQASDVSQANWNHFISEIDKGIAEGWLEGVTFESLNQRFGNYHNIQETV